MRRAGAGVLAVLLTLPQSSCIYVAEERTSSIGAAALVRGSVQERAEGPLLVRSLTYRPALLPLEAFFRRLRRGELKRALRAVNVRYSPASTDDEAMKALIARGYAPVYVEVINRGSEAVDLSKAAVLLAGDGRSLAPVPNVDLPTVIETLNPAAAAANVYNTGAVLVGVTAFFALIAATILAASHGSGPVNFPFALDGLAADLDGYVYNSLKLTTTFDYNGLLYQPKVLAPGESAKGLLFFHVGGADWSTLSLTVRL